jgi:putative ABC transport system substrate-binding protein
VFSNACVPMPWSTRPRLPSIGFVSIAENESTPAVRAFVEGLHDLGYIEGKTIDIQWLFTPAAMGAFADFATDLVRRTVAVVVVFAGAPAAQAAKRATTTIPMLVVSIIDPVQTGLVLSLASRWQSHRSFTQRARRLRVESP